MEPSEVERRGAGSVYLSKPREMVRVSGWLAQRRADAFGHPLAGRFFDRAKSMACSSVPPNCGSVMGLGPRLALFFAGFFAMRGSIPSRQIVGLVCCDGGNTAWQRHQ